jgi:hypothetical protein
MWKLIFLVMIVWLVISILKRVLINAKPPADKTPSAVHKQSPNNNQEATENMVQCSNCQIHLPRSEAFMANGQFYCSLAHIQRK